MGDPAKATQTGGGRTTASVASMTGAAVARAPRRQCVIPAHALMAGDYRLTVEVCNRSTYQVYERLNDVIRFSIRYSGTGSDRIERRIMTGATSPGLLHWSVRQ